MLKHYTIPGELLQEVVDHLNSMPAGQTRKVLNKLEAMAIEQDKRNAEISKDGGSVGKTDVSAE